MRNELCRQIMKKYFGLRARTYSYITENNEENKKAKKCVIKRNLKFWNFIKCLKAARLERKIKHLEIKVKNSVDCLKGYQKDFVVKTYLEETIKIIVESFKAC